MNPWLAWALFFLVALVLGLVGYHFSLRALRIVTAITAMASAVYITSYGSAHPAEKAGGLSGAFARGADALGIAFFRTVPGPAGWIVIAALLVIGYRQLEAWALHNQARSLDTSALSDGRPGAGPGQQRHDHLATELKFRLPAVQVRSPAILPGGSRAGGLASIAEASGLAVGGLAGAIINFFGMLWPGPRRLRVQAWVERTPDCPGSGRIARVTVDLDDPRTGLSIATKTLTACCIDHAASVVAGYVARYIFAEDRTAPPWCTGAADGRDLAALLIARQVRDYPESQDRVAEARRQQIQHLEGVAGGTQCAGVTRYELAQLYDLTGEHVKALLMHAINREQYPHFYRGRYRLAMSLEMLSQPGRTISAAEATVLDHALEVLHRCDVLKDELSAGRPAKTGPVKTGPVKTGPVKTGPVKTGTVKLKPELQGKLLDAAWDELCHVRRYLSLPNVLLRSFWHRDERGILRPYRRQPYRQSFHDGVSAAILLIAVRRANLDPPLIRQPPQVRTILRIATAITGDGAVLAEALKIRGIDGLEQTPPPVTSIMRTRHWHRPYRTRSWQAGYNLACAYAALAQAKHQVRGADQGELSQLTDRIVKCLWFTVCNPESEMERPWDWIFVDPDFQFMNPGDNEKAIHQKAFAGFREFLRIQKGRDYPSPSPAATCASAIASVEAGLAEAAAPVAHSVKQFRRSDDREFRT